MVEAVELRAVVVLRTCPTMWHFTLTWQDMQAPCTHLPHGLHTCTVAAGTDSELVLCCLCRARLSPLAKEVYTLCDMEHVATVLVVLRGTASKIVVKGMPAFRAEVGEPKVRLSMSSVVYA